MPQDVRQNSNPSKPHVGFVVAVSGVSGAGKSSVVDGLCSVFPSVCAQHFDDYAAVSKYPPDLQLWLDNGADVDQWKTPDLCRDLRALRSGMAVDTPAGRQIQPGALIALEEPFGRTRKELNGLVDLAIFIDVPLDLLVTRRLLRRLDETHADLPRKIKRDLAEYVAIGRDLHLAAQRILRSGADVIVDGTRPLDDVITLVAHEVRARWPTS